jgi:hypothetical protein
MVASGLSFVSGLPGGWWVAATIPADATQFFYNAIQLLQKLAYIYGWPELTSKVTNDELVMEMALFLGVMMGNAAALSALTELSNVLAKSVAENLPKVALTKYALYNTIKQVAKWIGISVTKESFAKGLSKVIPILGGIISGTVTAILMSQMGDRLIKYLQLNSFNPKHLYNDIIINNYK